MSVQNDKQLQNTRAKLKLLEDRYAANNSVPGGNERVRQLTNSSLKRLIHQLTEEIVRYEARPALRNEACGK